MSGDSNESTTRGRADNATAALRRAVTELNDLVLFADLDDKDRQRLADQVADLVAGTQASGALRSGAPGASLEPALESWGDYRRRSPFAGTANPRSPGLRMRIDTDAAVPTARGTVTVGAAFAGPPTFVHGGILAGLVDEAIGWLAAATMPDAGAVTGKLSVRFSAPTPVHAPLDIQVTVTKQTSLSMTIAAEVSVDGTTTVTGEALMIVRR